MLARSFMAAAELKIPELERDALIRVLHMLERDELVDVPRSRIPAGIKNGFSMSVVGGERQCGTVGCIMGWCQVVARDQKMFMGMLYDRVCTTELYELFMYGDQRRHKVTTEQAARALSNYLTSGHARWNEILA